MAIVSATLGPIKSATVGPRRGNLNRKEVRNQTEVLEQQNALLAQQTQRARAPCEPGVLRTPDGKWVGPTARPRRPH